MRLVVARCEVTYSGRLTAHPPGGDQALVFKADGSEIDYPHMTGSTFKRAPRHTPDGSDHPSFVRQAAGQ